MRYLISFSYDGSKFNGFQRQKNVRNVQGEIENALSTFYLEKIVIKGAGRTDKGVHAYNQKAHFDIDSDIKGLKKYLNKYLNDIKIKSIKNVDDNFHARHSVKRKKYIYKVSYNMKDDSNYYLLLRNKVNLNKMKSASKIFIGTHDFKNFVSGERINYETTIYNIKIVKIFKRIYFIFDGIGFYRYMIRNLVGALLEVGKEKVSKQELNDMLSNVSEKRLPTAFPNGLYLVDIKY